MWNTDLLFWFELESYLLKRNNCCNNSVWAEPLDSLFLLLSVTVWHKNLLNRRYEQNLCLCKSFFCLFIEKIWRVCFRAFLCLTHDFRNVGKVEMWQLCSSLDTLCPVVWRMEPPAALRVKDNHVEQKGFWEGREKLPVTAWDKTHEAEEDGNLLGNQGNG